MRTTKFRVPDRAERKYLRANGIDPDGVMVSLKSDTALVLQNVLTNDDIVIHPGPRSKREFPSVWEERSAP